MAGEAKSPYVSRGGVKLRHALDAFGFDPRGLVCADLGCSTGGFTDCLIQAGAARVHAVDTGYGVLAWRLRQDARVVVHERSNALHLEPSERAGLVVIDAGWTPQGLILPAARRWLEWGSDAGAAAGGGGGGRVIALVKPHYEDRALAARSRGVLSDADARGVSRRVLDEVARSGWAVLGEVESPVRGSGGGKEGAGNLEWLALLAPEVPEEA